MKKLITLTAALAITGTALFAQKVSFGIKGGVQQNSVSVRTTGGDEDYTLEMPGIGFQLGGVADIAVSSNFSVQPNLLFNYRSVKTAMLNGKMSGISVDLPINALYRHNGFFIGAGPNLSYNISGKIKPFTDGDEDVELFKANEGEEEALLTRFEIGVNAMMGYQFPSGFGIAANFTRGFNNLVKDEEDSEGTKFNFKQFGISFIYMFNAAKKK